jgi:hypothetical protein
MPPVLIKPQIAILCFMLGMFLFLVGTSIESMPLWIPGMLLLIFGLYGIFAF